MNVIETIRAAVAPRVADALAAAGAKEAALLAEVQSYALDEFLGDAETKKKRERAERDLAAATAEVARLRAAHATAIERDARKATEVDIEALQAELVRYEGYGAARCRAMADLTEASRAANEAARRFLAATNLMQTATPAGCGLPRGLLLGRDVAATEAAVKAETDRILGFWRSCGGW